MVNLVAAAAFFLLIHFAVSGTRVRDALIGRVGQGPYMGLFVVASFVGLGWLGFAFAQARGAPANEVFWGLTPSTRYVQIALQLLAMLFIVPGLMTPNPTSVRQEATLDRSDLVKGMLRITRHPFLWGVAIWATGHLLVNGDAASLVLFGSLLLLALFGTTLIDAKRKRALGLKYDGFLAQTSNVPFLAIAQGRQRFSPGEIGLLRIAIAVAVWAALLFAHPYLFGVRALP